MASLADRAAPDLPPLREAAAVWARIALLSFGGPAGQIAVMHRILVDEKKWIGDGRFLHALNFCMLLPGPEAQQLATYLGWLMHRTLGGIVAGLLFILPGMIAIMALSFVYVLYGGVGAVAGLFFGLKAAVLAIVAQAVLRIGRRTLGRPLAKLLAAAAFVLLFLFDTPFPIVILAAGLIGVMLRDHVGAGAAHGSNPGGGLADRDSLLGEAMPVHAGPRRGAAMRAAAVWLAVWLVPVGALLAIVGPTSVFSEIALFFSQMALVTFGGAYAVLAYVAQEAVTGRGWLLPGEMIDGLAMAETTPGPLIMVLQFVGFMAAYRSPGALDPLAAATIGGLIATWVTFAPCFLWIFLGAPFVERLRGNRVLGGALAAIGAAVVGVIANLALWFAIHTLFAEVRDVALGPVRLEVPVWATLDVWALALALAAGLALTRLGVVTTLALAAIAGVGMEATGLIG